MERVPVLVVGAGPIGLEVAWALKWEGIGYVQVEAGVIGSTFLWWAPGTRFFSSPERIEIAGVPLATGNQDKASREEYLAYLRQVAGAAGLGVRTGVRVMSIRPVRGSEGGFAVGFKDRGVPGELFAAKVVLAIGDMHRPRMLGVEGEDLAHVSHYLREPHVYYGRRVVIVGGRNSAVEAAIRLHRVGAAGVTLVHRGAGFDAERIKYWLLPEVTHLIRTGAVRFVPRGLVRRITCDGVEVGPVEDSGLKARPTLMPADDVLLLTGYVQDASLFESAGMVLEGEGRAPKYNPMTMETTVPGLYVAGTAAAGTQSRFKLFIENCHVHGARIAAHIAGHEPPRDPGPAVTGAPES
jgi:thioredoxin reductase (NADPH)